MLLSSVHAFFPFFHFHPVFLLVSLLLYFLPAFLARHKPNFTGVLLLNIFLGWTFIGWIIALVWAVSNPAVAPQGQAPGQVAPPPPPAAGVPPAPAAGSFFCSSCGKPCPADARFCSSCGAPLPAAQR